MRVAIVGAGAMGSLFGGFLAQGHDVWLIDTWEEHVLVLKEGLVIEDLAGRETTVKVRASTEPEEVGACDLVLVFVKSYHNRAALNRALPLLEQDTVVLTLQNGLGNIETIGEIVGAHRVLAGVTAHGATLLDPGRIRHAGSGLTVIGEPGKTASSRVENIQKLFNAVGLDTMTSDDILSIIWSKLMVNVGINALTALTGLRNGDLLEHEETRSLMSMAVREAEKVAAAKGVNLTMEDPLAHCLEVARKTAMNRSSMLQDIERGRRTEIDTINGAIVKEAEELGIDTPSNKGLTLLVKMMEKKGQGMSV